MRLLTAALTIVMLTGLGLAAQASERVTEELAATREALFAEDSPLIGAEEEAVREAINELIIAELHRVQIAVERWGVDNSPYPPPELSIYPLSVNQLVHPWAEYDAESYIEPGFYVNPLSAGDAGQPSAICVPFGWHELSPGSFSYLTQINEYTGEATGYVIVGYGPTRDSKWDLDGDGKPEGAIIVLASGSLDYDQPLRLYDSGREVVLLLVKLEAQ